MDIRPKFYTLLDKKNSIQQQGQRGQSKLGSLPTPPLQGSLPKMSEKMRKIFEFRIQALTVLRHHQEEHFCKVL